MAYLFRIISFFCLLLFSGALTHAENNAPKKIEEPRSFSHIDAIILGAVQGATEYLPVSSTGHLIIANHFLGLDKEPAGELAEGTPSLRQAANAYAVVIQGASILAVMIVFWAKIKSMIRGLAGHDPTGLLLLRNLILALIPTGVAGLIVDDYVDNYLYTTFNVCMGLIGGALVMLVIEYMRKQRPHFFLKDTRIHQLTLIHCLFIGSMQALALWPGTSRSMITLIACYCVGLRPARAACFSFLLGLVTIFCATGYKLVSQGPGMIKALSPSPVLLGCLVTFIVSIIAIKWFIQYINHHGLTVFAWYRIILASLILIFLP